MSAPNAPLREHSAAPTRPAELHAAAVASPRLRTVGHFALQRLLGKSELTMAWAVSDTRDGQDRVLVLPRVQPSSHAAVAAWDAAVRRAARINHPNLAEVVEVGSEDRWPYVAYDAANGATLRDRLAKGGMAANDAARCVMQALQGLAFAHEAGSAHRDLQPYLVLVSDAGQVRLLGLEAASTEQDDNHPDAAALRAQRNAAQSDVLCAGLLLHLAITGQSVLDEPDFSRVVARMPPLGRDIVRLGWGTAAPVPDALRAIANRATDRQERQRYRSARTFIRALEGWLQADAAGSEGPLALVLDRLRTQGVLPAMPGGAARAARIATMERERTNELAELVMQDIGLSFELLRVVNSAAVRAALVLGSGPVLTVRRAIALLGLDGVRRAANVLRPWPGPLSEAAAMELERLLSRVRRAAQLAQALRPAGYDPEMVSLVTQLQNLGRLVVQYHFPEESAQVRRLMQPAPSPKAGEPDEPGMPEDAASFAVLGVDLDAIGPAVARQWGMDEGILKMLRREPPGAHVHAAETDDDMLRAVASCANECMDALAMPAAKVMPTLTRVANRYARTLGIELRDLQEALHMAPANSAAPAKAGSAKA